MNIGIDFDGVLFDTERMFQEYAKDYASKHNLGGVMRPEELRAQKRYDWSKEDMDNFIAESTPYIERVAPILPNAKSVLEKLKQKHKIYAITGRYTKESIERTNERLKNENIVFDKVIYGATDKLDVCKKLKIELMIDDYFDEVERLSDNGISCMYYREFSTKVCDKENVVEVHGWNEIHEEFKKRGII